MADPFGLSADYSNLSPSQADTARNIRKAFEASYAARARNLARYNLGSSGPMLQEFGGDAALQMAQAQARALNQNQQLQQVIDESHRTPHGVAENLSSYLPAALGLARLYPALFGTDNSYSKTGLFGAAKDLWGAAKTGLDKLGNTMHQYTDPRTGMTYLVGPNGVKPSEFTADYPDYGYGNSYSSGFDYSKLDSNYGDFGKIDWGNPGLGVTTIPYVDSPPLSWGDIDPGQSIWGL